MEQDEPWGRFKKEKVTQVVMINFEQRKLRNKPNKSNNR